MAPPKANSSGAVRLLPAAMVTLAAVLGLKAIGVAQAVAETATAEPATTADAAPPPEGGASAPAPNQCPPTSIADLAGLSQAEVQVLEALGERREALDQRAAAADTQDELMMAAERRLAERIAELRQLETHVNDLLGQLDEAQEQRLTALVDVYQRMRAKDAATVFDGLDDDVLVQVASRMRQSNLAEVMGRMDPTRARALTRMLADRARPPTDGAELLERARGGGASGEAAAAPSAGGG
jgi:flagellar motility protein MotE (MotC chaperone)